MHVPPYTQSMYQFMCTKQKTPNKCRFVSLQDGTCFISTQNLEVAPRFLENRWISGTAYIKIFKNVEFSTKWKP